MQSSRLIDFEINISKKEASEYIDCYFSKLMPTERCEKIKNLLEDFEKATKSSYPEKRIWGIKRKGCHKLIGTISLEDISMEFGAKLTITIPNEQYARRYGSEAVYKLVESIKKEGKILVIYLDVANDIVCRYMHERQMPEMINCTK